LYNGKKVESNFEHSCNAKNGESCGNLCGACYEITGINGVDTFIVADICDVNAVGEECSGK